MLSEGCSSESRFQLLNARSCEEKARGSRAPRSDGLHESFVLMTVGDTRHVSPERIYRRATTVEYRMYRRELLGAVMGVSALAGCNGRLDDDPPETDTPDGRVELVEHGLVRRNVGSDEELAVIEGTVRINEPGLEYIELRAEFYDTEGELLDTTLERIQELEEGKQEFTVEYPRQGEAATEVETYDISVSTVL